MAAFATVARRRAGLRRTIRHGDELFDWYAYFTLGNGSLKLRAVRTLGLSGMPYDLMKILAQRPVRTDQQEWEYQNLHIAFLSDVERLACFRRQLGELETLKSTAQPVSRTRPFELGEDANGPSAR